MSRPQRFHTKFPVSSYCTVSPLNASRRRSNGTLNRPVSNLAHTHRYESLGNSSARTHTEWENEVIEAMALDDDYYYFVEDEEESKSDMHDMVEGVDEMEVLDEMESELDMELDIDVDMETIQSKLQRYHIEKPISLPTALSSLRPMSLSKRLGASHIANTTTLDTIMEEDIPMDTDIESKHISIANNMDLDLRETDSLDTEMDCANIPTMPPTPGLARVHQIISSPQPMTAFEMFMAMEQSIRDGEKAQRLSQSAYGHNHATPVSINGRPSLTPFAVGSSPFTDYDDVFVGRSGPNKFDSTVIPIRIVPFIRAVKRTRDMVDDGEENEGTDIADGTPPKRLKLMNDKTGFW